MYKAIHDRSNLEDITTTKYWPEKYELTRLQDLATDAEVRTDVVMISHTRSGQLYFLHVAEVGFAGDLWILDVLDEAEYQEVKAIGERMRENARRHPVAQKLIVK